MRVVVVALVLTACASRPAQPPHAPAPRVQRAGTRAAISTPLRIRAPRPDVSFPDLVPDLAEEPRWPLTGMQHPSLQPSFDVADALAEPGIGWMELCARNVDRRRDPAHRDELLYLAGWCAASRHDAAAAVALLAQVRGSAVPGISRGVGFDIANILVDTQDAEHADQILVAAQLRSAELYDLLAASYFEIGRNDDSVQATSAALQLDARRAPAATCHRLARVALLGPEASRGFDVDELSSAAHAKQPDPVCVELAAEVSCVVDPAVRCHDYEALHHVDHGVQLLAALVEHWREPRDWRGWLDVALDIHRQGPQPQTLEMESGALDAAVVGSECKEHELRSIADRMDQTAAMAHAPGLATRIEWARSLWRDPDECTKFRARWLTDNPQ
jgi:hypothetical protein